MLNMSWTLHAVSDATKQATEPPKGLVGNPLNNREGTKMALFEIILNIWYLKFMIMIARNSLKQHIGHWWPFAFWSFQQILKETHKTAMFTKTSAKYYEIFTFSPSICGRREYHVYFKFELQGSHSNLRTVGSELRMQHRVLTLLICMRSMLQESWDYWWNKAGMELIVESCFFTAGFIS